MIRAGVLRFYFMREGDEESEEGDKSKDMWVLRLAPNSSGTKLQSAIAMLDSLDVLDCISLELQQDRAPKGGIQRSLENALEKVMGNRQGGRGKRGNQENSSKD